MKRDGEKKENINAFLSHAHLSYLLHVTDHGESSCHSFFSIALYSLTPSTPCGDVGLAWFTSRSNLFTHSLLLLLQIWCRKCKPDWVLSKKIFSVVAASESHFVSFCWQLYYDLLRPSWKPKMETAAIMVHNLQTISWAWSLLLILFIFFFFLFRILVTYSLTQLPYWQIICQ